MQVPLKGSSGVFEALRSLGRTEDVHFSPSNRRLAIAGMVENRILVLELRMTETTEDLTIEAYDYLMLQAPSFRLPHGLFWLDEETLIVANRGGGAPIIKIPPVWPDSRTAVVLDYRALQSDDVDFLKTPGSVSASRLTDDIVEVLVCNGYANYVSRHLLDARSDFAVMASEVFVKDGLDVPDGVAYSPSGRWLAVSNHNDHSVFIYQNDARLGPTSKPSGVLRGMSYPHGLRFTPDECFMLVADAGRPFVHVFAAEGGDWGGDRKPATSVQVIEDDAFKRGQTNPQEGGPKGIDLDRHGRLLVASCEEQPLVFFDIRGTLSKLREQTGIATSGGPATPSDLPHLLLGRLGSTREELGSLRQEVQRLHRRAGDLEEQLQVAERRTEALTSSTSWRITAPLRALSRLRRR